MKPYFLFLLLFPVLLSAQLPTKAPAETKYTYIEDREFLFEKDLAGYVFVPHRGKLSSAHFDDPVKEGLVQIKVTTTDVEIWERVTFSTGGIKGENDAKPVKMSIPSTVKKSFGFEIILMDIHNPDIQGYIQFYAKRGYIYKIVYRLEPSASERTYLMMPLPDYQYERDGKFFAHDQDYNIKNLDILYEKRIFPHSTSTDAYDYREFSRLFPADRVYFKIEERLVPKGRREKKVRYFVMHDGRNKEQPKQEFIIKKVKDTRWKDRIYRKELDCLELTLVDETSKEERKVQLIRNSASKNFSALRYGETFFNLRKGKRVN